MSKKNMSIGEQKKIAAEKARLVLALKESKEVGVEHSNRYKRLSEEKQQLIVDKLDKAARVYYVYTCAVDGVVRYVGYGKANRFKHCNSGKSSCMELNRDFHDGKEMVVVKVKENMRGYEATALEAELIQQYGEQLYNKKTKAEVNYRHIESSKSVKVIAQGTDNKKVLEFLMLKQHNIDPKSIAIMLECLEDVCLSLYLVDGINGKALVIDNYPFETIDPHIGCKGYPFCSDGGKCLINGTDHVDDW